MHVDSDGMFLWASFGQPSGAQASAEILTGNVARVIVFGNLTSAVKNKAMPEMGVA